ncbi:MAG: FtsH protease activity modulator HflK [Candidatus Abyssobacteria bacterium SURF_17]|uniref:Protein HflK n=1 Tax=Candidatus Abyssobacteria bacterium SURF_17 TaxID=2093361 RepID=A0A419F884_9BACT|nr:MAG: FtsH protease activity modulator HflK [Candidatus Abyssubacteria bacterium SURF_17]
MNPRRPDRDEVFDISNLRREIRINISPSKVGPIIFLLMLLVWLIFGGPVYIVDPDEEGIIQTFGKYTSSTSPGLHFKLPWPIQTVKLPKVTEVKRLEIGFRTKTQGPPAQYRDSSNDPAMLKEAQMLTGDENVVNSSMIVQYKILDPVAYLFNVIEPDETLHDLAEAAQRQVVGNRLIDDTLTIGKTEIQFEIAAKIQSMADLYGVGVQIIAVQLQDVQPPREVANAFKDVATAKEDRDRIINTARGYQNEQIPKARGQAAQLLREAEAYERERIARAEGDASRFLALAKEYEKARSVTKERLYLETMKTVLPRFQKVIVDEQVNVINLNQLTSPGGEKKQ